MGTLSCESVAVTVSVSVIVKVEAESSPKPWQTYPEMKCQKLLVLTKQ